MAFAIEPVRKIEIRPRCSDSFVDVSDYIIDDSRLTSTIGRTSTGAINLDISILDVIPDLDSQDEIKVTLGDTTPDTLFFTGLLDEKKDDDEKDIISWTVKDYSKLASNRRATEVYREDAGTGDPVEVFKDLVDKYLTELSYDAISIPVTPAGIEDFKDERLQNKSIKEEFDFIAKYLGRIWYVDKNKKIWLVTRTFTDTDYELVTKGTSATSNIIGNLTEAIDTKRWANYIAVDGKSFPVGYSQTFSGDALTKEFTLTIQPKELTITVDGVVKRGGIEGSEFEDDADYLVDKGGKSFEFTTEETPGIGVDNVVADITFVDKIHDEFPDSASINRYGKRDKLITDESIETLNQAEEIANNYRSLYSEPLKIYSGKTFWNENVMPLNNVTLKDSERSINLKVNVMQVTITFGRTNFDMRFKLNDYDFEVPDLYGELVNRVSRIEFNERDSGTQIAKYLFFGAKFALNINTMHISTQTIGTAFILGHSANGILGTAKFGAGTMSALSDLRVINANNTFKECFFNENFKEWATADWNTTLRRLGMTTNKSKSRFYNTMAQTKVIFKNEETILKGRFNATESIWGNDVIRYFLRVDGTNWEEVELGILHTFVNVGEELEAMIMFSGNGADETYIEGLRVGYEV